MKEKYFQNYIVNLDEIYDPEVNSPNDSDTSNIILKMLKKEPKLDIDIENIRRMNDKENQSKIKSLNKNLDELFALQKENEKFLRNETICTNDKLLNKMMNKLKDGLLTSIIVYYDEIFDLLMDEILGEEVKN